MNSDYAENISNEIISKMGASFLKYLKDNNIEHGKESAEDSLHWLQLRKENDPRYI